VKTRSVSSFSELRGPILRNVAPSRGWFTPQFTQMDKDRIEGAANRVKGATKQTAGNLTGDKKLRAEGTFDKGKGHVASGVGGATDTLRDK